MKKVLRMGALSYILLSIYGSSIMAGVTFGSRDSTINVASGATFNVGSSNLTVDGTFKREIGSEVTGNPMLFHGGVLNSAGLEAVMEGTYDPTGDDIIRLEGNGSFRAEPGTLLHELTVSGVGNYIAGQPLFGSPITLANSATELGMGIESKLNQNIELNGGTVVLHDDLALCDGVYLVGDGKIQMNDRQLKLGSEYPNPWSNSLYYKDADDLVLSGSIDLMGTWTFGGISVLNGNGCVLDMSKGGSLLLDPNATLLLNDIHITGLGNSAGQLLMGDGAQIRCANCSFKLNDHMATTQGSMYVYGPTTFQLGNKNWAFNGTSNLTVDGTTLWVDYLDSPITPGNVYAPLPLFDEHKVNYVNLAADLASGTLSLINRGTIKESVDADIVSLTITDTILQNASGYIDLKSCVILGPNKYIRVVGDATIDGHGAAIKFCGGHVPQLHIQPGLSLTLKNVRLVNINDVSLDLRNNTSVLIDNDVIWELDESITFSSRATIQVLDTDAGQNIFTIRGEPCRRMFNIMPAPEQLPSGRPNRTFNLGHNTIQLENAGLSGFDYISFVNDSVSAAVSLSCNSAADINSNYIDSNNRYGTSMNFFVEGINNDLILRKDGMVLYGNILFGDLPTNELNIQFDLAEALDAFTPGRVGILNFFPFVVLAGDPGIFLWSELGLARLNFNDFNAAVRNDNTNAFVADENAVLTFKRLQLVDNPVKQNSARFRFEGIELLGERIDPSFIRSPMRSISKYIVPTAIWLKREQQKTQAIEAQKAAKKQAAQAALKPQKPAKPITPKLTTKPKKQNTSKGKQKSHKTRTIETEEELLGLRDININEVDPELLAALRAQTSRAIVWPAGDTPADEGRYLQQIVDQLHVIEPDKVVSGDILFERSTVQNFQVAEGTPFNVLLKDGTTVEVYNTTALSDNHIINVRGKGNVIRVMGTNLTIGPNNLYFDEGAELTFELPVVQNLKSQLIFAADTCIDLEKNAIIRFKGSGGTVFLGDDVAFNFKGTKTAAKAPAYKTNTVTSRAFMELTDGVVLTLQPGAYVGFYGVGGIRVENNASITLDTVSTLYVGAANVLDLPVPPDQVSDFIFEASDIGRIVLSSETIDEVGNGARFLTFNTALDLRIGHGGSLLIDKNSIFGINSDGKSHQSGWLTNLMLSESAIQVRYNGMLALGANRLDTTTGLYFTFPYNALSASIQGAMNPGLIRYDDIAESESFTARMNVSFQAYESYPQQKIEDVVRLLVQQSTDLIKATLFTDADGKQYIRTKDGDLVTLRDGDVITGETSKGYVQGDNTNTGVNFSISPNGVRKDGSATLRSV